MMKEFFGEDFLAMLDDKKVTIAGVKFQDAHSPYNFYTNLDLQVGDVVVCDTAIGLSVGVVSGVNIQNLRFKPSKWIVDQVNMDSYMVRRALEEELEKAKKELEELVHSTDALALGRALALVNEDARTIIDRLKLLSTRKDVS